MASAIHKIDPNGDTIIILRSPANPEYFALWDDSPFDNLDILGQLPFSMADEVLDKSEAAVHQAPSNDFEIMKSEHTIPDTPVGSILYHVSSAHLRMASPVFRKMLSPDAFREGHRKSDDRYYINADDWEEEVLLLFLNMLHLRSRKIPQRVDLELLAKIGIIVDYYDCGDAVEFFTTSWVYHTCAKNVPFAYSREVLLRLWVSYVFRDEYGFSAMTHIAISYCNESAMRTLGLPIPQAVLEGIEHCRTAHIKERLSRLPGNNPVFIHQILA
ncbi:hypothetical protein ACET3X_003760 [Alternaria dauci]|uniref:BTB domain-containing protein n=1 Tax=Alternaria dauci TaxID=48095 RepID=A0ABR3ULF3_9PLEO